MNALISAAFSLSLVHHHAATEIASLYGMARTLPLAITAILVIVRRSYANLAMLAPLLAVVQMCDAVVGFIAHDVSKIPGPLILAALTATTAVMFINRMRLDRDTSR